MNITKSSGITSGELDTLLAIFESMPWNRRETWKLPDHDEIRRQNMLEVEETPPTKPVFPELDVSSSDVIHEARKRLQIYQHRAESTQFLLASVADVISNALNALFERLLYFKAANTTPNLLQWKQIEQRLQQVSDAASLLRMKAKGHPVQRELIEAVANRHIDAALARCARLRKGSGRGQVRRADGD